MAKTNRTSKRRSNLETYLKTVSDKTYTKEEKEAITAQYSAVLSAIEHEDGRRWILFGAVLAGMGLLVPAIQPAPEGYPRMTVFGLGIFLSVGGWLVIWRNNVYLKDRTHLAMAMERALLKEKDQLWLYDENGHIPRDRLRMHRWTSGAPLVQYFTAWGVMRTTLWTAAILWSAGLAWQWPHLQPHVIVWTQRGLAIVGIFLLVEVVNRVRRFRGRAKA